MEETGRVSKRAGGLIPASCLSALMARTIEHAELLLLAALRSRCNIKSTFNLIWYMKIHLVCI